MFVYTYNTTHLEHSEYLMMVFEFAREAHESINQLRKFSKPGVITPYMVHPLRVSKILMRFTDDEEIIAASLLHDVVEDTPITNDTIRKTFGNRVADLVDEVTDISVPEDGSRATRKGIDRDHLASASPDGKMIKLADLIDNTSDIVKNSPKFAPLYLREKDALLKVLGDATSRDLYRIAKRQVDVFLEDT